MAGETMASVIIMIMSGPDDGLKLYLRQEHSDGVVNPDGSWVLTCGRRDECDVSIPFDTQVSRQHAKIKLMENGEIWLIDTGSLNGTFVDNRRIEKPTLIGRGQLFRLGRTWVRIQEETDGA